MEFLKYIASLAQDGETVLIVKQKPKLVNGALQFYADGAIKATWPSFYPDHKMRPGEAWYANTAAFILDRMPDGPSASRKNCEYVVVLMLDDIGTKSKTPPLEPTWKMETSPGNFQWGYAFSEQPTKGAFSAAVRAIAEAGYTDPGAINPVRNFRLPGSVNLKPQNNKFESRLAEFHPEREFTLEQICEALGVTPGEDETNGPPSLRIIDDGGDDIVGWLSAQGAVYSQVNKDGWMAVLCPNAGHHSDGDPEARYNPSLRAFCCYHGHCTDKITSRVFLDWIAGQGGPAHTPGVRPELLQSVMANSIGKITPTPELAAEVQARIDEVDRREAGRLEMSQWWERFAYLQPDDAYFDLAERREITRKSFNALYRHLSCPSVHLAANGNRRRVEASIAFDERRQDKGSRVLHGLTYAPGETVLCTREGAVFGNRWNDARPQTSEADITPWLNLLHRLLPNEDEREHILDVMACKIQRPNVKINHAVLHGGTQGCGKDTLWAAVRWAIGGLSNTNVYELENDKIMQQWGYHLECELLIIQELRQTEAKDRRALENQLKPIIAAPPEYLTINRKGLHPYAALNRLLVVAFTNQRGAISIDSNDRRWFVVWSDAPRMEKREGHDFWDWYKTQGGFAAVANYLHKRDISAFSPGATPFTTEAKENLIERGMSTVEGYLLDEIRERRDEFALGAVAAPFYRLLDSLQHRAPTGIKLYLGALYHAFTEAKWVDMGPLHSAELKTKKRVFCAPELVTLPKSELRRLAEQAGMRGTPGGLAEGLRRVK